MRVDGQYIRKEEKQRNKASVQPTQHTPSRPGMMPGTIKKEMRGKRLGFWHTVLTVTHTVRKWLWLFAAFAFFAAGCFSSFCSQLSHPSCPWAKTPFLSEQKLLHRNRNWTNQKEGLLCSSAPLFLCSVSSCVRIKGSKVGVGVHIYTGMQKVGGWVDVVEYKGSTIIPGSRILETILTDQ